MKQEDKDRLIELANRKSEAQKYCFCKNSTMKWVKMFAEKRFNSMIDINEVREDDNPPSEKIIQQAKNIFVEQYSKNIEEYIKNLPKEQPKKKKGHKNEPQEVLED